MDWAVTSATSPVDVKVTELLVLNGVARVEVSQDVDREGISLLHAISGSAWMCPV